MPSIAVVGIQWGDEGKGKIVDLLAQNAKHIVRSQGGNNAGHTIAIGKKEYKFHLLPSGILHPHVTCYIGGGTVIDPEVLLTEIEELEKNGIATEGRLFISPYAHVIMPYHKKLDCLYEDQKENGAVGTTGRGIGPCYSDRANRIGIRICELMREDVFKKKLQFVLKLKNNELNKIFDFPELDFDAVYSDYSNFAKKLFKYVGNVEEILGGVSKAGGDILFEGAQGTFLDIIFGTYPYVTSSSSLAAGVCGGAGIGPTKMDHVIGVVKAYNTRVGNGPFPTSLSEAEELKFMDHASAREIGTTTQRKRRMGWFDAVLARYGVQLNGVNSLALTKLDVLDALSEIKICIGYELGGERLNVPPPLAEDFERVIPIYETLAGWKTSTKEINKVEDLPKNARNYIDRIEDLSQAPISILSVGPEREKTLFMKNYFNRT